MAGDAAWGSSGMWRVINSDDICVLNVSEDGLCNGEVGSFVVDSDIGFLEESTPKGVLTGIDSSPERKIICTVREDGSSGLEVEGAVRESNVDVLSGISNRRRKSEGDSGVLRAQLAVRCCTDSVELSGLIPGQPKGLLKELACSERKPHVR